MGTGKSRRVIQRSHVYDAYLEQKKQQHYQLYMSSVAATTQLLERRNTASGSHFNLQMVPLSQH